MMSIVVNILIQFGEVHIPLRPGCVFLITLLFNGALEIWNEELTGVLFKELVLASASGSCRRLNKTAFGYSVHMSMS